MLLKSSPAHASEAGHWYAKDGSPAYEVIARNGSPRPTTLRDARKVGLVPSVTMISRCAAQPGLEIWKQQQVLLAALTLPRLPMESDDAYMARIMADSREQATKARDRGTEIHAAVQGYYEDAPLRHDDLWPYVNAAIEAVREKYGDRAWIAEKSFAHPEGFGGKVDLHCDDDAGPDIVIDFKSKEFTADNLPRGWDEQAMQLSAYREGLQANQARCANVFVSTNTPGLAYLYEWSEDDLAKGWQCFRALLAYWQAKNGYRPQA